MKKIIFIMIAFALCFSGINVDAQGKYKFGHIDSNKLISLMPDRAQAQKKMEEFTKELEDALKSMQDELQVKYQKFVAEQDSLSDVVKQTKAEEINNLDQRIQQFQVTAQQELQKKESELLQPIYEKAQEAIKEVGEENGFTYIYDGATLLYFSKDSQDVLPLVKKKLGIE